MGTVLDSIDNLLTSSADNGPLPIFAYSTVPATTTAANTTSGYQTVQRFTRPITQFAPGAGLTGAVYPYIRMVTADGKTGLVCAIEYLLGTLTISTNTFVAGVTMPTKLVAGSSIQTATMMPMLAVSTALTATTPTITTTYTDQDGNAGNSCVMTLPTNALVDSAFQMVPHLASGDTGVRAITNMSTSGGSAGVLRVYGLLVLNIVGAHNAGIAAGMNPLAVNMPKFVVESGDTINFYRLGVTTNADLLAVLNGIADN